MLVARDYKGGERRHSTRTVPSAKRQSYDLSERSIAADTRSFFQPTAKRAASMRSTCSRPASRQRHDILPSGHERFTLGPARRPDGETIDEVRRQPVRHEIVTHVLGTTCYLCLRAGKGEGWRRGRCIPDSRITNARFAPSSSVSRSDNSSPSACPLMCTFATCGRTPRMSVHRGRPEVIDRLSERRF